jgi:hypothetical protein
MTGERWRMSLKFRYRGLHSGGRYATSLTIYRTRFLAFFTGFLLSFAFVFPIESLYMTEPREPENLESQIAHTTDAY